MQEFKNCPVVMLPTSGSSVIGLDEKGKPMFSKELGFGDGLFDKNNNFKHLPQHIYVLLDNEIKKGDRVMFKKEIHIATDELSINKTKGDGWNKIIATTDPELELPILTDLLLTDFHINGLPKEIFVKYQDGNLVLESTLSNNSNIITKPIQKNWNFEEVQLIATRFAHQCRLKGITTNYDTVNLFEEWAHNNIYFKP